MDAPEIPTVARAILIRNPSVKRLARSHGWIRGWIPCAFGGVVPSLGRIQPRTPYTTVPLRHTLVSLECKQRHRKRTGIDEPAPRQHAFGACIGTSLLHFRLRATIGHPPAEEVMRTDAQRIAATPSTSLLSGTHRAGAGFQGCPRQHLARRWFPCLQHREPQSGALQRSVLLLVVHNLCDALPEGVGAGGSRVPAGR